MLGEKELTGIEVLSGPGGKIAKSMGLALMLLVGGLWPRKFMDSLISLF